MNVREIKRDTPFDVFTVDDFIYGRGIAHDTEGRSLLGFLTETGNFVSAISLDSTKMMRGGLRYLGNYAFILIHKALLMHEDLWRTVVYIVAPLRIDLPYREGPYPAWFIRLGLFHFRSHQGRGTLLSAPVIDRTSDRVRKPLQWLGSAMAVSPDFTMETITK